MEITEKDVERVARLARLRITPEERALYRGQLEKVLEHMAELKALNTNNVPPTSGVLGFKDVMRDDVPTPFPRPEDLLNQAPESEGPCFKVPKVIE